MSAAPDLKVVELRSTTIRDASATLRKIADSIDEGQYGDVSEVALVILGDTLEVFGFGAHADGTSSACLLQAGAMRIIKSIEGHGQ